MDRKILCNRKDDFKAYTAPHGSKQGGGCRSAFVAAHAQNIGCTTVVPHNDERAHCACDPDAGDWVCPVIN